MTDKRTTASDSGIPEDVRVPLSEALICFQLNLLASSLLMSTRAIEMAIGHIFRDEEVASLNISQGLQRSRDKNLIDTRLFEWGTAVSKLCHPAPHHLREVAVEDAQDTLMFASRFIDSLYVLPLDVAAFRKRRQHLP